MVKISYKDKLNWTDLDGLITNWSELSEYYFNDRILTNFIQPIEVLDNWNGVDNRVQIIHWKGWYIEFNVKESSIHTINDLLVCDTVLISDLENGIEHTVDTRQSEYFQLTAGERIGQTSNIKYTLIYRTNRKVINKGLPVNNTHELDIDGTSFYTDFDIISPNEIELSQFEDEDSITVTSKVVTKDLKRLVFYLLESDAYNLRELYTNTEPDLITLDSTYTCLENRDFEPILLNEGLYRCELDFLTTSTLNFRDGT
jgi:hypothetical protein